MVFFGIRHKVSYFRSGLQNEYMKLKESVRQRIDNSRGAALIMLSLNCGYTTARDYIRNNKDDLTKAAAMKVIRKETGLTDEEILEEDSAVGCDL